MLFNTSKYNSYFSGSSLFSSLSCTALLTLPASLNQLPTHPKRKLKSNYGTCIIYDRVTSGCKLCLACRLVSQNKLITTTTNMISYNTQTWLLDPSLVSKTKKNTSIVRLSLELASQITLFKCG